MKRDLLITRPDTLLYAEAFFTLAAACVAYHLWFPHHWILFGCLFLAPDLSLLPYLRGPSAAANVLYNAIHSYVLPILLGLAALYLHSVLCGEVSLIWICHVSWDRMIGYGLKYPASFKFTHLQNAAFATRGQQE